MKATMKSFLVSLCVCACAISTQAQVDFDKMEIVIPAHSNQLNDHALGLINAMISGDFSAMKDHMHDDLMVYGTEAGDSLNAEAYLNLWKSYHKEATDLKFSQGGVFAIHVNNEEMKGDAVLGYGLAQWTPKGTSQPIYSWTHLFMRYRAGKVWKIYTFQDQLPILLQAGFTVSPPAANK